MGVATTSACGPPPLAEHSPAAQRFGGARRRRPQLRRGERQGQQLEEDALASLTESGMYMQAGSNAESAGQLTAWGTALAGAADVWSKWRAAGD